MIRLTSAWTKEYIWVNPDHIVDFGKGTCQQQEATYITTVYNVNHGDTDTLVFVTESPEEVARMVLDYKTAIIQYQTYIAIDTPSKDWTDTRNVARLIKSLAGLEEQKDE